MRFFSRFQKTPRRIYLDYAAATPVHADVRRKMEPYFTEAFGNPSAIHEEGRCTRAAIDQAREELARTLRIRAEDCIFTGSGTEANNLALYGSVRAARDRGVPYTEMEILSTEIEHPSVLEVLRDLEKEGVRVRYVSVNESGLIDERDFEALLSPRTLLVTFAYANSEIGSVQRVKRLTRIVRSYNRKTGATVRTHLDASQAPLWLPCGLDQLSVDLMTLDAGKCHGPKGVGVLAFRHGIALSGVVRGGDQERGLRAGTENTPLIVGCSAAIVRAQEEWKSRSLAVAKLRDEFISLLKEHISGVVINGGEKDRIANNVNISIPGIDSEFAVVTLDTKGVAASTKSACSSADSGGSRVVQVVTKSEARAASTIRFSLGEETKHEELEYATTVLKNHVEKMRRFSRIKV